MRHHVTRRDISRYFLFLWYLATIAFLISAVMSYFPPIDGVSEGAVNGTAQGEVGIEQGMQGLSLKKKKRSARAYHSYEAPMSVGTPGQAVPGQAVPGQPMIPAQGFAMGTPGVPIVPTPGQGSQFPGSASQPGQLPGQPMGQFPTPGQPMGGAMSQFPGQPTGQPGTMGQFSAPGQPIGQPGADYDQSLSVPHRRYTDQNEYMGYSESLLLRPFLTFENIVSPSAGTQYHSYDQGTASSKFIRSTMYNIPENEQLRQASKLPVAVTVRPFAPILPGEAPIPVVDMRETGKGNVDDEDVGPIRCNRCRTYMNPSMQHSHNNKFTCNICHFTNNTVPADYSSMITPGTNRRADSNIRPELHKGVYDILVPKAYNFGGPEKDTKPMHHVILVDISINSIRNNLPSLLADTLRSIFYNQDEDDGRKFAIILFDKKLHFYNLLPSLDTTQITISSDLDDPFVPFFEGLFANPEESRMAIEDALNNLEEMCNNDLLISDDESCYSAALRTAMLCLKEVGGGKITSVLTNLPSWGPGGLSFKDPNSQAAKLSPEVQKKLYNPDSEYYKLLAKDFLKENVGLDCFIVSTTPVDLANIGWLCSVTGGVSYKWTNFNYERDAREFSGRFTNSILKSKGYQGQLKLRCSNGLQVSEYYGTSSSVSEVSVVGASTQDPIIPVISEDYSVTILLEYDGQLSAKNDCHFQAALLYTDVEGNRKVRVINLVLAVSERLTDIFHFVDQDAVVTTIVRDTLSFVGKQVINELRESVAEKLVEILTQYRAKSELGHNANRTLTNQLLMPDSLSNLPMYILAFLKTNALKGSSTINVDKRLEDVYHLLNMPIERLMYQLYPALVEVHSLTELEGTISTDEINVLRFTTLPKFKELSLLKLEDGVYILCDGRRVLVWVRPHANPLLLKDLFGDHVDTVEKIDSLNDELPDLPTDISQKARNLIEHFNTTINGLNCGAAAVQIIRESYDGSDILFKEHLVEDGSKLAINLNSSTYIEFLSKIHKAIKVKLENDKTYSKVRQSITQAENPDTLAQRFIQF